MEAFSDGVFAIAITLLAIELRPPEVDAGQRLAQALWQQWPSYRDRPSGPWRRGPSAYRQSRAPRIMLLEPTVSEEGKGGRRLVANTAASLRALRQAGRLPPAAPTASIELYWLPLGAGGWFVRLNGAHLGGLGITLR